MYYKNRLSLAVSTALGLSSMFLVSNQALAQDADENQDSDVLLEEVIVTGTRLVSEDGFGRTSPVTVVGLDDIKTTGLTRVEDVLNSLPQIEAAQNSFISNGSSGTASIDLRGLGSNRTLVLVNGRRLQPGGVYSEAPDVNQIPSAMIERVEVLTGGASATYGADAVAGVVNFIMRRLDGVEVSGGWSAYRHDNSNSYIQGKMDARGFDYPTGDSGFDGEAYNLDFAMGGDFADGRGNATLYASWRKNNELRQESRDYSSCALSASGTSCGGSANAIVPNFFIAPLTATGAGPYGYDYDQEGFFTLQPDSTLAPYTGNLYNYAPINHFQRPDERFSAGAFIDFEINEHAVTYLEVGFANDRTRAQIAESGTFFAEAYPLPITNSVFPANFAASLADWYPGYDEFGIYIGKRNVEGGPRSDNLEHTGFRIVTGLKGALNDDWNYDMSYLHAQTSSSSTYINDFFGPNIFTAVNGDLCAATSGCIPYEVFTYQGVTPEMASGLTGVAVQTNFTSTKVFNAFVTGDLGFGLGAGDISIAAGYEWRQQRYENLSDSIYEQGLLLGQGGPQPSIAGGYSVDEFFAEANIPLLSGAPFAENLTLDLAYRWSDYTTSGSTSTYRAGVDWAPIENWRVRAGYNRAVRAPNVNELFVTQNLGLWSGVDPCATANPIYTAAQCANTGVSASQYGNVNASPAGQYNALYGGNPNLDPEEADTYTFGVVWDILDNMTLSVDYWDIEINETIGIINPELMIDQCALYGTLCENIVRAGNGSLWQGTAGYVIATNVNLGSVHYEGVDVAWAWTMDAMGGTMKFDLIGTYMLTKETSPLPNDPNSTYDCVGLISTRCFPSPEWRHTATASYDSNGFWSVSAKWRFYQDVNYEGSTDVIVNDSIGNESYFDLAATFRFMDNHEIIVGMNNILDEEPPMMGNSLSTNANTVAGFWDTLGRYAFANVTFRF